MGETTAQIEAQIEQVREDLGSNFEELERKVRTATDWKAHVKSNPGAMLGVAFGGGMLLAMMTGGGKQCRRSGEARPRTNETWNRFKNALLGVAATRVTDFIGRKAG
jgi:hypothetical protein